MRIFEKPKAVPFAVAGFLLAVACMMLGLCYCQPDWKYIAVYVPWFPEPEYNVALDENDGTYLVWTDGVTQQPSEILKRVHQDKVGVIFKHVYPNQRTTPVVFKVPKEIEDWLYSKMERIPNYIAECELVPALNGEALSYELMPTAPCLDLSAGKTPHCQLRQRN